MKIGITERGDAGLNFNWIYTLKAGQVDGAILITKNLNDRFIESVMDLYNQGYKNIIIHCTCTGWGHSKIEPNVPSYEWQLGQLQLLIQKGFPVEQCVLRIDPIFPTPSGIKRAIDVIEKAYLYGLLPSLRIRISVLDEYKHVKERFQKLGFLPIYGNNFYATHHMMNQLINALTCYSLQFECCAEPYLTQNEQFISLGCISEKDLSIMNLPLPQYAINPQNRKGCLCLSVKQELLRERTRCSHKCEYCFWKD